MYLFQRIEYYDDLEKIKIEPHLIKAETYKDAMVIVAMNNKYSKNKKNTDLNEFLKKRYEKIIELMPTDDPMLEQLEIQNGISDQDDPVITSGDILLRGVQLNAITSEHLERFIFKSKKNVVYYLKEITVE
jgi:hypothetical protein